ncbi:MAG: SDR family oxidoreductase [Chloroflexi bacterium]|nr:SDR family oxidoreductase [Chloroflexota bacterium]
MDRKTALVTGASRGLGLTLSRLLAQTGHDLVITARGAEALESVSKPLESYGGSVLALPGDVSDPEHRRRLIEATSVFGRLDVLINNASSLGTTPLPGMTEYPLDDLEEVLRVNLLAPLGLTQEALPLLIKGRGLVVNISSDAAIGGYEGWGGYGASKAALDLVSLTLANELRDAGVGVVSVDPGDMQTQMHQDAFPGEDITDRPLPESTLPFWAWLLSQDPLAVSGHRYQAQSDRWEIAA